MIDAIVVGGGIGGLASAWNLSRRGLRVRLIEAGDRLGGVIRTTSKDGCTLEHGPDSLVSVKPGGLELVKALGLEDRLVGVPPAARQSYIVVRDHRLVPVPEGLYLLAPGRLLPFARSPLLSWPGKLRMLADLALPRRRAGLPEESLAGFVRRRLGVEALRFIAQPLVSGIYTADPETLSLAATMPVFLDMEREHRSLILAMMARVRQQRAAAQTATGPRYGLFLSLGGGLQTLVDALVAALAGVDVQLGTAARSLTQVDGGWAVDGVAARRVVLALPAHAAAALAPAPLGDLLRQIPYAGVATVNLAFDRAACPAIPPGAGFVIPACLGLGTVACTFAHQKYPDRCRDDTVLLRAFVGGALHEHLLERDDATLVAQTLADLRRCLGALPEPRWARLHRWPKAMAQYTLGHRERVAAIRAATPPGLHLVGNGYEGVGIPDLAAQAAAVAAAAAARGA